MKFPITHLLLILCICTASWTTFAQEQAEPKKESVPRFLNPKEIKGLQAGDAMDMTKIAEINGYPDPDRVLRYAGDMNLSGEQAAKIMVMRKGLRAKLRKTGEEILAAEYELEQLFSKSSAKIERDELVRWISEIASLRAKLRLDHLYARVEMRNILTNEQIAIYNKIQGYAIIPAGIDGDSTVGKTQ